MENGTSKFHQNTRRTERKALAAGFCTLFSKSPLRRVTALVLVTAIALGFTVTAVAQQVDPVQVTDPAEFPTITVETNLVMNEASGLPDIITDGANKYGFIEVSLRVTPGTSGLFSGAALALTYDETILTPVTWNQLDETTGKRDKYEVVNTTTSVIPFDIFLSTKKADIISTASAYVGGSDGAGKSLLYLNAESEYPTPLAGDSRLVVVRFRYDATANPLTYDATAKAIMNGANAVTFLGWASDANAALSFAGANAYFTGKNEPLVRESMYYIHKDPNPAAWTKTDADGLSMPDTACFQLVKAVKSGGTSTDADYYSYVSNFFPVDATYMASFAPPLTEPKIKFTQVTAATADQGSGGISLDDVRTVVALSWSDEFIGAAVVANGAQAKDVGVKIDELTGTLFENYSPTTNGEHPSLELDQPAVNTTCYDTSTDVAKHPLTGHKGYNFAGWTIVNQATSSDVWTSFDTSELAACQTILADAQEISEAAALGNVFLKAVYVGNEELNKHSVSAESVYYTYQNYNMSRIDDINTLFEFSLKRLNSQGYGVTRLKEPLVRLTYGAGGATIPVKYSLSANDTQTVQLVLPSSAESAMIIIVDGAEPNIPAFTNASAKSLETSFYAKQSSSDGYGGGWVYDTTWAYIQTEFLVDQATGLINLGTVFTKWNTGLAAAQATLLGWDEAIAAVDDAITANANLKRNVVKNRVVMYRAAMGNRDITHAESLLAVNMDTGLYLNNTITAAYLAPRTQALYRAFQLNGNADLTEKQICEVLKAFTGNTALTDAEIQVALAKA